MLDVLSVGNANMDFLINSKGIPDKNIIPLVLPGGSASNFAIACAKLGLKTGFLGFTGRDAFSDLIINNFKCWGVKAFIKRVNKHTGIVLVFTKKRFKRMIHYKGANEFLKSADLKPYADKTSHLHLATPPFKLLRYLRYFKSASVDPGSSLSVINFGKIRPFFKHINVFIPNELEIESICGCNYRKAAVMILDAGCKLVIVKRGWKGCYAADGEQEISLKAFPQQPIDTTGAGDSFNSAFINAWLKSCDLRTACLNGLASAHKTIHHLGPQNSATAREIKEILKKY